ncbi:MAG: type VI secretion system baseplate subunit TssE [Pirellulaceae bacterium]
MAELTSQERLQPSLLDRLTDDRPDRQQESRDQRVFSTERLRSSVLRDLAWLLNTGNLAQMTNLEAYPEVASSVLNYGTRDLAGLRLSLTNQEELEDAIRQSIIDFEPRILADSVRVRAVFDDHEQSHNTLQFEIQGDLWNQPLPLQLYLSTVLDLESGTIAVQEGTIANNNNKGNNPNN